MPITAKLSRQFYEKLGDEVTNELVTWLNAVDDSYRQEFRDLFAANFSPLRAEIEARMGQLRTEMAQLRTELNAQFARIESLIAQQGVELRAETDIKLAKLRVDLGDRMTRLVWWMLGFWIAQVGVTISAIVAARQLLR